MEEPIFVAREGELERLNDFLSRTLAGQGAVCFVRGEAGSGKTALVTEFARRAQEQHKDLVVAVGQGDAQTGVGDPYLPFREVLEQLTGDVDAKLAQGAITQENAGRLRKLLRLSGQALADVGPDLIAIFVPFGGLAMRVAAFVADKVGWLDRLGQLAGHQAKQDVPSAGGIEQSHIFEQYTNVLRTLAAKQPLLLLLDDLQWADSASIDLFSLLGWRIEDSPILVVGTYRPDEVALGRAGERHPLEKVLAEFKRYRGDIWVDLDRAKEVEGRHFVDTFLDTEPNRLGEAFRQALYQHTGGHPLFTIELLRDMQERGDLVKDQTGCRIEGPVLDWGTLPARVEGVIEERIGRLEKEVREVLTVGSVEGEDFTAEVVACVQTMDARELIRRLSRELDKRHRLVSALGIRRLGAQRLSLYRFRHNLLQAYLYNRLDKVERTVLHEDVGRALEELYGDEADEIAVQLARHFVEAGIAEKAIHYLCLAGEQARVRFANAEAVTYLSHALDLTPETDNAKRYGLLLKREKIHDLQGARQAQRQDLVALDDLANALADEQKQAEVALRQANYADVTGDYPACIAAAQTAIRLTQDSLGAAHLQVVGYLHWGRALWRQGDYGTAYLQLEQALSLAQTAQLPWAEADSLRNLGIVAYFQGDYARARAYHESALRICHEIGDRRGEGRLLVNLGTISRDEGDYAEAKSCYEQALRIHREIGDRQSESAALGSIGSICGLQGDYVGAKTYCEQALRIHRETGDRWGEGHTLNNLGLTAAGWGNYAKARAHLEHALRIFREIGDRAGESLVLGNLGDVSDKVGDYTGARAYLEEALVINRAIGDQAGLGHVLAGLGLLSHHQGDNRAASDYSQQALRIAQDIGEPSIQGTALISRGRALAGLGQLAEAADAYRQSLVIRRELGQHHLATESLAGLARVSLAQGNLPRAQAQVDQILRYLESGTPSTGSEHRLLGAEEPFRVYLTCYRVLRTSQDPRAPEVLATAHRLLQERAAKIADEEMQRSFLENVSAHREIAYEFGQGE